MTEIFVYLTVASVGIGAVDHTIRTQRWLKLVREAFETWNPLLLEQQRRMGERDLQIAKLYRNISLALLGATVFSIAMH